MIEMLSIKLIVNGIVVNKLVDPRQHLTDFLRSDLGLTGSHIGCEHGVCGACSVRVNGRVVRGCLMLASQSDGAEIETIEGLVESGDLNELMTEFVARNALQCGFCTPGILLTAAEIVAEDRCFSRQEIRNELSGNICRCTGYQAIIDAIEMVLIENMKKK
jgi:carbon-monoxide dehydrogenase small subunit